jgi:hypothetical protein
MQRCSIRTQTNKRITHQTKNRSPNNPLEKFRLQTVELIDPPLMIFDFFLLERYGGDKQWSPEVTTRGWSPPIRDSSVVLHHALKCQFTNLVHSATTVTKY